MKYLITMLFSVFTLSGFGQWIELTTGTTNHLNAVQFLNVNNGFSVGDNGTFLKTTDGGVTWTLKSFPSTEHFKEVHFINATTGFICSDNRLYKTIDGGVNFTEITSELLLPSVPSAPMHQIRIFFNGDVGIITALWAPTIEIAIKTNDGGVSWAAFSVPNAETGFGESNFSIINSNTIYSVKNNKQYKTTDNGINWSVIRTLPANISGADNAFSVFNVRGQGYASMITEGFMHISSDASSMTMPTAGSDFHAVSFLNADTGYVMRDNIILKTKDAGMTFSSIHTFTSITSDFNKWHLYFVNQTVGFVCGRNGKIFKMGETTSINNPELKAQIKIFPNPVIDVVNIECISGVLVSFVRIFDITGRVVKTENNDFKRLDISLLNPGVYWLEIQSEQGNVTEKIIVQ